VKWNYFDILSACVNEPLAEDLVFLEYNATSLGNRSGRILGNLDLDYSVTQRHNPEEGHFNHTAVETSNSHKP
jgi:hypothetical protein